jgi:hypothetical protein
MGLVRTECFLELVAASAAIADTTACAVYERFTLGPDSELAEPPIGAKTKIEPLTYDDVDSAFCARRTFGPVHTKQATMTRVVRLHSSILPFRLRFLIFK